MQTEFKMSDLWLMSYFLSLKVYQQSQGIFLIQMKYAWDILKKFKLEKSKPVSTPLMQNEKFSIEDGQEKVDAIEYRSIIGSLIFFTASRLILYILQAYFLDLWILLASCILLLPRKSRGTLKEQSTLVYFMKEEKKKTMLIVIGQAVLMMEKSISGYFFSHVSRPFSENSKNKKLLLSLL